MARTSSVVMASTPQPKETSCTSSTSGCAADEGRRAIEPGVVGPLVEHVHRLASVARWHTLSSLTTTKPSEVISWSMPWPISGSMW